MAQDNATINLYINNEQAKASIAELDSAYQALKKSRKEAEAAGNMDKRLDLKAQEEVALKKLQQANEGIISVERVLGNLSKVNTNQLYTARRKLRSELNLLNRDTDEYRVKLENLKRVELELANASSTRSNAQIGFAGSLKKAWTQVVPAAGLAAVCVSAFSIIKTFAVDVWDLTKTIQGESKRAAIVFGEELGRVELQAGKLAAKAGLTAREMVSMASATADLLIPLGFARDISADMSIKVQTLTGALDEWTAGKFGADEISRRLTKAMLGETETLKELGIAVRLDSDEYKTLVKQKLADGAASTGQAQALAILDMLYQKSADAQAAYASSGNELLRFQKSSALGWRQMKESVAEWFATTSEERVYKKSRAFAALNSEFNKNESAIGRLLPRYQELSSKSILNVSEQSDLRRVIDEIVSIMPQAASGFDQYNKALGVNVASLNNARQAQRLLRMEQEKDLIKSAAEDAGATLDDLMDQQTKLMDEVALLDHLQKNKKAMMVARGSGVVKTLDNLALSVAAQRLEVDKSNDKLAKYILLLKEVGLTTEEAVRKINNNSEVQLTVSQADGLTSNYLSGIPNPDQEEPTPKQPTPKQPIAGNSPKQYSLTADKEYMNQKLALQQQLQSGEIASEQEHSQKLLALEISMLEARIVSGKSKGEDLLELNQELADKRYAQKKSESDYAKKLLDAKYEGEPAIAAESRAYENRLKDLGLFGLNREALNQSQLDALETQERIHNAKMSTLRLTMISDGIATQQQAIDRKLTVLRMAAAEELASADTFEGKKLLLSRWFSAEELRMVTKDKEADRLLKGKYEEEQAMATKAELSKLISYYENFTTEISVMNPFGALVDAAMTDEDRGKLESIIDDLKSQLSKLGVEPTTTSGGGGAGSAKTDVLGFTAEQWTDTFSNLESGKVGLGEWQMILQGIGNAFGEVSKLMSAVEQRDFKQFAKTQDKKRRSLDRQLQSGVISQAHYNSKIQEVEAETEAKREEMDRKRAAREKMMSIFQALINTAVGITAALTSTPPNVVLAAIVGAMGAIQVGTILATPVPGAEEGGYIDVDREQDGKRFRAKNDPSARGVISSPTLIGEAGTEYVVPNAGYRNPTIRPVLDIIEQARRSGSLNSINLPELLVGSVKGRQRGGYITDPPPVSSSVDYDGKLSRAVDRLLAAVESLDRAADIYTSRRPRADVVISGRGGFAEKYDKYKRAIDQSRL